MKEVRVRTDGKILDKYMKFTLYLSSVFAVLIPILGFIFREKFNISDFGILGTFSMYIAGIAGLIFFFFGSITILYSEKSLSKKLRIRKKLIMFTRLFTKMIGDGFFKHSVLWKFDFKGEKLIVELYPKGLVSDKAKLGQELAEYIEYNLLKYEELDSKARYIFGEYPKRLDGKKVLKNAKI